MSLECKFKGTCKDCKIKYEAGTQIDKNNNGNWCPDGINCSGTTKASKPTEQKPQEHSVHKENLIAFVKQQYEDLHTIETTLLECNETFKDNGSRLGMYINNTNTAWQKIQGEKN